MAIRPGVLGVVYMKKNGKYLFLILHRVLNWEGWEFVKGGMENESDLEALKREIIEETGIKHIKVLKELCEISYDYPEEHKKHSGFDSTTQKVFLVETDDKDIALSEEHDGFLWLDYQKAKKHLTWEHHKNALDKAFEFLNKV